MTQRTFSLKNDCLISVLILLTSTPRLVNLFPRVTMQVIHFWPQMPLTLANNVKYLYHMFLFEDFVVMCLRFRLVLSLLMISDACGGRLINRLFLFF